MRRRNKTGPRGSGARGAGAGSLLLCGLGIDRPNDATLATLQALKSSDVVFYIHGDGVTLKGFLKAFCPDVRTFDGERFAKMGDEARVRAVGEQVCKELSRGRTVAYVTYGHPLLFSDAFELGEYCWRRGYACRSLPAVSSIDGVISALHDHPDVLIRGFTVCEAKNLLVSKRPMPKAGAHIVLCVESLVKQGRFPAFCRIIEAAYPGSHEFFGVNCSDGRRPASLVSGRVKELRGWASRIQHMMSLVIPGLDS